MALWLMVFQYIVTAYEWSRRKWLAFWNSSDIHIAKRYYLSDENIEHRPEDFHVPKGCVYVEEWVDGNGHKKNVVHYEDEMIAVPQALSGRWLWTPFDKPAKCPWVWVGDRETEIDLTRTFNKFLVPGNIILPALVNKLIQVTERTNLIYIETGTFKEVKFPGEGIVIQADE